MINGEIYPQRLDPLWKNTSAEVVHSVRYLRTYTILSIIMVFFIFSFVGWSWEVCLHLIKDGVFVNRGVMHGPWLPVYGSGVSLIVVLLARWRGTPYKEAFFTLLLCGTLEYMTSLYLEMAKGMRWWDYTGYILNFNGRISAAEEFLRERLIDRRMKTGVSEEAATDFVDYSDMPNAELCLTKSLPADLQLMIDDNGEYLQIKTEDNC